MARQGFFANWDKVFSISFGLVYILFLAWLIFHTFQFVPQEQEAYWFKVFISYGVLNTLIVGNANLRNKLFNVKLISFLPRFLFFFGASLFVYYFLLSNFDIFPSGLAELVKTIPLWLAVIHALVFATTESVIWQGYLDDVVGRLASCLIAGVFHWGVWSGGALLVIPTASILFMIFSFVHYYFRANNDDLAPVIGNHTAFNLIKLGFMFK